MSYCNGIFVAVAVQGPNRVMRSTDGGLSWSSVGASSGVPGNVETPWNAVTYGAGTFVAVGDNILRAIRSVTALAEPPTDLVVTRSNGLLAVSWAAPADGGSPITSYTATASPGGASCTSTGDPPATSCTITGLTNGTPYTVTVTATNAVGTGPPSAPAGPFTPNPIPGAPATVTGTPGDGQVALAWTEPSDGGSPITSYTATASPGGATCAAQPPATSCTIGGLTNGTTYTVTVTATNAFGNGPPSQPVGPFTPGLPPSGQLTINGGALATTSPDVRLAIATADYAGLMRFRTGEGAWSGWTAATPTTSYAIDVPVAGTPDHLGPAPRSQWRRRIAPLRQRHYLRPIRRHR